MTDFHKGFWVAWALLPCLLSACATAHSRGLGDAASLEEELALRLERSEQVNRELLARMGDLSFAVDALRLAVTRLRGRLDAVEKRPATVPTASSSLNSSDPLAGILADLDEVAPELSYSEVPAGEEQLKELPLPDAGLLAAREAAEEGDCATAVPKLSEFIRHHPLDPRVSEAFLLTGRCYLEAGEPGLAALQFRRVADSFPGSPQAPQALEGLVQAHRRLGEEAEAQGVAKQLKEQYPSFQSARSDSASDTIR